MVAPHDWATVWPLAYVQRTVQPRIAAEPAVTRTSAWKPPLHWPVIEYDTEQLPLPGAGVVGGAVVGGGVVGGAVVGGGVVGGVVGFVVPPKFTSLQK